MTAVIFEVIQSGPNKFVDEGQGKATRASVCPLKYAAHVLITKLQDFCCKKKKKDTKKRCKH